MRNFKEYRSIETLLEGYAKEDANDWLDELPDEIRNELNAALSEAESEGAFKTTAEVMFKYKKWP